MPSNFFKDLLSKKILSKLEAEINDPKAGMSKYETKLKGRGFEIDSVTTVTDTSEPEFKEIEESIVNGVVELLNKQIDKFDFFNPTPMEDFRIEQSREVKTKKQGIVGNMRLKNGTFTNPMKLTNLINNALLSTKGRSALFIKLTNLINNALLPLVLRRMGPKGAKPDRNGPLVNRTERLVKSGFVSNIIANSDRVKTVYFKYQRRPYSVFEHPSDNNLSSQTRDPRRLFANAITDALKRLLHRDTLASNTFGIRTGNYLVGRTTLGGTLNER